MIVLLKVDKVNERVVVCVHRCSAYNISAVDNLTSLLSDDVRATLTTTPCDQWQYDRSQYKSTIVTLVGLLINN